MTMTTTSNEKVQAIESYLAQCNGFEKHYQHWTRRGTFSEGVRFVADTAGAYRWWRAKAWSGKSALLSWFVLHPPPGVRIVSFFITARLASQNDRSAFIDNVLVKGLGSTLSGRYLVQRVRHTVTTAAHKQSVTLVRNALGLKGDEPFGGGGLGGLL